MAGDTKEEREGKKNERERERERERIGVGKLSNMHPLHVVPYFGPLFKCYRSQREHDIIRENELSPRRAYENANAVNSVDEK